jgi:hypothetical protein
MIKFKSEELNLLVQTGKFVDEQSREFIKDRLGIKKKKVESKRHTILSGPPGVGKTYGTIDECNKAGVNYKLIEPGSSDIEIALKLAVGVHLLKPNEELNLLADDADDLIFGELKKLNKWKIALADMNSDQGIIPHYTHPVSMSGTLSNLQKQVDSGDKSKQIIIDAIKKFSVKDGLGLSIPMDRVRVIVLCNTDLEDEKTFSRNKKMKAAIDPVRDRMKYKRINLNWEKQWGWTAYVLGETQPFKNYPLKMEQKVELMTWMHSKWDKLRSTSYRTVKSLAEAMINYPNNYYDAWNEELKGH